MPVGHAARRQAYVVGAQIPKHPFTTDRKAGAPGDKLVALHNHQLANIPGIGQELQSAFELFTVFSENQR